MSPGPTAAAASRPARESTARGLVRRRRARALERPPWERSVLDDVAARRPWNLLVKAERLRALRRLHRLTPGVTVLVVTWNTREVTADVLRAVQAFSPPDIDLLLMDNASTDGSRETFAAWPGLRRCRLPVNVGHGIALDLGVARARTSVVVSLDSDAVPLCPGWLDAVVPGVLEGSAVLAGLRATRGFVHPVFCAVDTAEFLTRNLSFQVHVEPGLAPDEVRWGTNAWDTGELMSARLDPALVHLVAPTPTPAGLPGMTTGGVVYHHGGVSRSSDPQERGDAIASWRLAMDILGLGGVVRERVGADRP